ncbi:hypothetical protein MHU86_15668 [Fragilaria crotonensis]|nr:hypothetical protein MHU86_15668 [Fragilaria crotonensis]
MRPTALLLVLVLEVHAFPITSSKSSKKDRARPNTGGGVGFGNKAPTLIHDACEDPDILNLLDFLVKKQGAILDSGIEVGVSKETGIRGVFCTRSFNKGEILCQVPSDAALALSDPSSKEDISLAQAESTHFDPTPDFYDNEELELLEFPRLVNLAQKRQKELTDIASQNPDLTLEQIQFAAWIVSTRALGIPITEGEPQVDDKGRPILTKNTRLLRVLVPFLDLVNHSSNSPNTELHLIDPEKDNAWFALKATRDIQAGKELLYSYGNGVESSVELLANYGFVPKENKMDALMLKKGGDDTLTTLDAWSTTLEEDETMLQDVGVDGGRLRTILEFRARMKKAIGEIKA